MCAFRFETFGNPSVLQLTEVSRPTASQDMALVRTIAASINPATSRTWRGP